MKSMLITGALIFSTMLFGCATKNDSIVGAEVNTQTKNYDNFCPQSDDGHNVTCGVAAKFCDESKDHTKVACGGQAKFCARSSNGQDVACGGLATYCESSIDGNRSACGGKAKNTAL